MTMGPNLTAGEIADSPTIVLGGRTFHIPPLTSKENRVVVGALGSITGVLGKVEAALAQAEPKAAMLAMLMKGFPIDEQGYARCLDALHAACTRAYPELSRAEFEALPIGPDEVLIALPVLMTQSFAFTRKKKEGGTGAAPVGELPPKSTGTDSLSESVEQPAGRGITSSAA